MHSGAQSYMSSSLITHKLSDEERCRRAASVQEDQRWGRRRRWGRRKMSRPVVLCETLQTQQFYTSDCNHKQKYDQTLKSLIRRSVKTWCGGLTAVSAGTACWTRRPWSDSEPPTSGSQLPSWDWCMTRSGVRPGSGSAAGPRCSLRTKNQQLQC